VPSLNVERLELLKHQSADVRRDLIFDQLPIALGGSRRDVAGGLPLSDPAADKFGDGQLARLDVGASTDGGDELGKLDLRVAFGPAEGVPGDLALACDRISPGLKFQFP
jgi:hypothetical protein